MSKAKTVIFDENVSKQLIEVASFDFALLLFDYNL